MATSEKRLKVTITIILSHLFFIVMNVILTNLIGCAVGGVHNDKERLPGEREQVPRVKAKAYRSQQSLHVHTHTLYKQQYLANVIDCV